MRLPSAVTTCAFLSVNCSGCGLWITAATGGSPGQTKAACGTTRLARNGGVEPPRPLTRLLCIHAPSGGVSSNRATEGAMHSNVQPCYPNTLIPEFPLLRSSVRSLPPSLVELLLLALRRSSSRRGYSQLVSASRCLERLGLDRRIQLEPCTRVLPCAEIHARSLAIDRRTDYPLAHRMPRFGCSGNDGGLMRITSVRCLR